MRSTRLVLTLIPMLLPAMAFATNGYFSHGVGIKAMGMAGATVALPQDALAGGNNPAAMIHLGRRLDLGVDMFRPTRESEIAGNAFGMDGVYEANETGNFFIPQLGYNHPVNEDFSFGLSAYGRGGMNTDYADPIGLFGATAPGVNLAQFFVAPSVAVKVNERHSLGIAVNIVYQSFDANGLEHFDNEMSSKAPGSVTDNDVATATGFGMRVGWLSQFDGGISLGAAYETRSFMSEFDEYSGLFAEEGDFDIPSSFTVGFAYAVSARARFAFDYSRILYSQINAVANPLLPNLFENQLGTENGAGFGWEDMDVFKLGLAVDATEDLVLRGGFNYGAQPIPESETLFNVLAPDVVESHLTLGGTYDVGERGELSFAFMHALENTVEGSGSIIPGTDPNQGQMGGGEADLTMSQISIGIGYGRSF